MKNFKIYLAKDNILRNISLITAYAGAKTEGNSSLYERVATVEADDALLSRFWMESCGEITEKLRGLITASRCEDSCFELTIDLSEAFDESQFPTIESDLEAALTNGMAARWFRFTIPLRAQEWAHDAETLLQRAFTKLYSRKKPVRTKI